MLAKLAAELPDAEVMAISGCICFSLDHPVAVLAVSARDVRLGLALTPVPLHQGFEAGRPIGAPLAITQTIALTDARQVTPELLALVRRAADPS